MKQIPLSQGKFAIVDDEDFDSLSSHRWCISKQGYAKRNVRIEGKDFTILMHREILHVTDRKRDVVVDHIDQNPLNNTKENIRVCDAQKNSFNKRRGRNTTSKFKGVCWDKEARKWRADIRPRRKNIYLGKYENEVDAALAYNKAALEIFGEYAHINDL